MRKSTNIAQPVGKRWFVLATVRWLILTLIGWLTYASVRALWVFVKLGAPCFDWQWYLVVTILLVILAVRVIQRLPRSRFTVSVFVGLLAWAIVGYFGWGQEMHMYPAYAAPVPISFWASKGIVEVSEDVLKDMHATNGVLYIVVGGQAFDGDGGRVFVDGLQRLAQHNIDVYLAVVASDYLSVPVHDKWIANVQRIADAVQNENLNNVRGIIGDAEHPKHTPLDILGLDREAFFQAAHNLNDLIQLVENEYPSLSLGVTALWPLYLDSFDSDSDLSIIHRSSVVPPGNWDFVNVMTYSSYFPVSWRAYYVYLIEQTMARLYPDTPPSHLIGLTAPGRPGEPTLDYDDLVRDARLSRAMGVCEIVVFKLDDSVLEDFGDDFVRRFAADVNKVQSNLAVEIPFSRPASMLVYGTVLADAILDARGWKGLLLVGWMISSGFAVYHCTSSDVGTAKEQPPKLPRPTG
jgi:hypothetical protein